MVEGRKFRVAVPNLAPAIPKRFQSLLAPGKIQYVFCTGNLCNHEMDEYLRSLGQEYHAVRGDMDRDVYPERVVVTIGSVTVGLCHGHQALPWNEEAVTRALRRDMGVDILIVGNSHRHSIVQDQDGGLIIDPGSATGVPTLIRPFADDIRPSFVVLDVQGTKIITYSYTIVNDDVKVDRAVYNRAK
mmetsp:Transcript_6182/g.12099  ORF Transcript_6182/g.12099 Transcript_6182/m.12099 type:complete len:187 (+) Transcript_6182:3279-3839(+)